MEIGSEIVEQIKELEEAWLQRTGSRMQRDDESWLGSKGTAASAILYQEIQTGGLGAKSDLRCVFKSPGSTFDICVWILEKCPALQLRRFCSAWY